MDRALEHLPTRLQSGVVSRRQLHEAGLAAHDLKRLLRQRVLTPVHRGVYVDHTGPLSWQQRAWAAVLLHWPAALARESALRAPDPGAPIQVAIDVRRSVAPVPGVIAHRTPDFEARVRWNRSPPRISLEDAAIDVAMARTGTPAKFQVLANAAQTWETTAARMAAALESRPRVPDRRLLADLLADLETGAQSVLEREYLLLERRHGLPVAERQAFARVGGRSAYRDARYARYGLVVELDGRAFHDTAAARDADADRDLDCLVVSDERSVRLTHGQVFTDGCRTIRRVATLLQRGGWAERPRACPACPPTPR